MKDNYKELCELLKLDARFVDENGNVLKNKVQECGNRLDEQLLALLMSNETTKRMFFKDINGTLIFDKIEFAFIVNSKQFLPDSYTKFAQNIVLTDEYGQSIKKNDDVVLEFPHKDCVLEFDSTEDTEKRDEAYLNEILTRSEIDSLLAPKIFTNSKKHTQEGTENITTFLKKDNLVIKGNNLIALHSLLPVYKGQIKLMYWDILYNTNSDQVPYNDSFKHSTWLTMMKNRLEIARELLSNEGMIFIQLDDNEYAYLKVLCDEIFKRDNYLNTVIVKAKAVAGASGGGEDIKLKKNSEYILIYTKKYNEVEYVPPVEKIRLSDYIQEHKDNNVGFYYTRILKDFGTKKLLGKVKIGSGEEMCVYEHNNYQFSSISAVAKEENISEEEAYSKYFDKIFMVSNAQTSLLSKTNEFVGEKGKLVSYEYTPTSGKMKGKKDTKYVWNETLVVWLKDSALLEDSVVYKTQKLGTLWTNISWGRLDLEGGVKLKGGKKPEALLKQIIEMATNPDDIVLDAYFGTGTTGAVAMKMGRRYIGIEQLNSHYEKSIERLTNVIDGDSTGISKDMNWKGGGSFISTELYNNASALINIINKADDNQLLDLYQQLKGSDFVVYRVDINEMDKQENTFINLSKKYKKEFLIKIIDKNQLYVNYSDIDNSDYKISENDKLFTKSFYSGGNN